MAGWWPAAITVRAGPGDVDWSASPAHLTGLSISALAAVNKSLPTALAGAGGVARYNIMHP